MEASLTFEYHINDIREAALKIFYFAKPFKIWTFNGPMGAGKTTLIKEVGKIFQIADTINSPTFSLVNEYATLENETIYHFDFYRINHESEALEIGADEYLYSGHRCWIEWPSKIPSIIPQTHAEITIKIMDSNKREVFVKKLE